MAGNPGKSKSSVSFFIQAEVPDPDGEGLGGGKWNVNKPSTVFAGDIAEGKEGASRFSLDRS